MKMFEVLIRLFLLAAVCDGLLFGGGKEKCPIEPSKASAIGLGGFDVKLSREFKQSLAKAVKDIVSSCKLKLAARESFFELAKLKPDISKAHRQATIGHALSFEITSPSGSMLCNRKCLSTRHSSLSNTDCLDDKLFEHGMRRESDTIFDEFYDSSSSRFANKQAKLRKLCASPSRL